MSLRSWAACYTEQGRFSPVGVAFHWTMAALILFQLGLGWFLKLMPAGGSKVAAYALHGTFGLLIFLVAFLRIVWRIMIPDPFNAADRHGWQTTAAKFVEHMFYACFLILPLSGWAMWSALNPPGPIDVLLTWPVLPFYDVADWRRLQILYIAEDIHFAFVWVLMLMIPLHVGAALKHHFWDRDDVLAGMLPEIPDEERPATAATRKQKRPQPRQE